MWNGKQRGWRNNDIFSGSKKTDNCQVWCCQTSSTPWKYSLGATKTATHPEDTVLVLPKQQHTLKVQSWCYQNSSTPWRYSLGATKTAAYPEDTVLVLLKQQHTLKIQSCCYQNSSTPWRYSLGATKAAAHPEYTVLVLPKQQHTLKIQSWCYQTTSTHWRYSFGATKPPVHPKDGDGVRSRNVGKSSNPDTAVCPRKFNWILSPRKLNQLRKWSTKGNVCLSCGTKLWNSLWQSHNTQYLHYTLVGSNIGSLFYQSRSTASLAVRLSKRPPTACG